MADNNSDASDDINKEDAEGASTDDTINDGADDGADGADDTGSDDNKSNDDADDDSGDGGNNGKKDDKGAKDDDDDKEPPVRRGDASRFIIARQQRKIAKLQDGGRKSGGDAGEGDAEDDDDVAPEDRALVERVIGPMIKPLAEKLERDEDTNALNQFFSDEKNAHFKPYEAKIRKWAVHPSRRNLPIRTVALEIAGDDLMKIGAGKRVEADRKAKKDQAGGGNSRQETQGADAVWAKPQKDFEAEQEAVRRKPRV